MPSSLKSTECPSFLIRCGLSTYSSLLLNSLSKLVPPGFCDSSLLVTHLSPVSVASSSSIVVRCPSSSILDLSSSLYTPCSSDLIFHSFGYHQCLEIPISSPEFSLGSTWISRSSLPIWRLCRHFGLKPQTELILCPWPIPALPPVSPILVKGTAINQSLLCKIWDLFLTLSSLTSPIFYQVL